MDILRVVSVLLGVVAAVASAGAPASHNVRRSTEVPLDYEATWAKVIDLFSERGWSIDNIDKDSGLITTDWMNLDADRDTFADCGGSGLATVSGTQMRFNVRVKPLVTTTELTVNAKFRQLRSLNSTVGEVECSSRGAVEAMVHDHVSGRTPAPVVPTPTPDPIPLRTGRGI
jgi:uncharacterized lipoprotein